MSIEFKELLSEVIKHLKEFTQSQIINVDLLLGQVDIIEWNGVKAVRKKFSSEIGFLKWLPPSIFYKASYPFTISPYERLRRELQFFSSGGKWYNVPKVYEIDEEEAVIIREFIDGNKLTYDLEISEVLGKALAEIHSNGYALGDVKPSNFIINDNNIYVIDAEQAVMSDNNELFSWDLILTLLFASYKYVVEPGEYKKFVKRLINSYLNSGGSILGVKSIFSIRNLSIALLIPPHTLKTLIELVTEAENEFKSLK